MQAAERVLITLNTPSELVADPMAWAQPYERQLNRVHKQVVYVHSKMPSDEIRRRTNSVGAVCLTGGKDQNPGLMWMPVLSDRNPKNRRERLHKTLVNISGQKRHPDETPYDTGRDLMEYDLLDRMPSDMPLAAVCRGAEFLAKWYGGDIYRHLPDEIPGTENHYVNEYDAIPHNIIPVYIMPGTKADTIFRAAYRKGREGVIYPGHAHHQGVDDRSDLTVSGISPDGVNEIFENPNHPFLVATQWHPEVSDELGFLYFSALAQAMNTPYLIAA